MSTKLGFSIERILAEAESAGAGEIILRVSTEPMVRIGGKLNRLNDYLPVARKDLIAIIVDHFSREEIGVLESSGLLEGVKSIRSRAMYVSCFLEQDLMLGGVLFKPIRPYMTPAVEDDCLNQLDETFRETLLDEKGGLLLVTGPRQSGKSSLAAGLVSLVDDAVAFIYTHEVPSVSAAPRRFQQPLDRRDWQTVESELNLGDTGRRVMLLDEVDSLGWVRFLHHRVNAAGTTLATVRSDSFGGALRRLVSFLPEEEHQTFANDIANYLLGVLFQELVSIDPGPATIVARREFVRADEDTRDRIRAQDWSYFDQPRSNEETNSGFDDALWRLVETGRLQAETARRYAKAGRLFNICDKRHLPSYMTTRGD